MLGLELEPRLHAHAETLQHIQKWHALLPQLLSYPHVLTNRAAFNSGVEAYQHSLAKSAVSTWRCDEGAPPDPFVTEVPFSVYCGYMDRLWWIHWMYGAGAMCFLASTVLF